VYTAKPAVPASQKTKRLAPGRPAAAVSRDEWRQERLVAEMTMAKEAGASPGIIGKSASYVTESWEELKKVHTPSRQETIAMTVRVFMLIFLFGLFLGLTDLLVGMFMKAMLT
jgi:preprotein translocase SecE subunit